MTMKKSNRIRTVVGWCGLLLVAACKEKALDLTVQQIDYIVLENMATKLNAGLSPNTLVGGVPLLSEVIYYGSPEVAELLLKRGADVNQRGQGLGKTPLYAAAYMGGVKMAALLIDSGADPKVQDDLGVTPLYTAAVRKKARMVEFLISRGADPKAKNHKGLTVAEQVRNETTSEILALLEGKTK